ncbi:MAG TPA: hypothetical protein VHR66_32380 [Gemmataceae bacterium]|nr:hypothetical protein [Gemmataceae bacterium]
MESNQHGRQQATNRMLQCSDGGSKEQIRKEIDGWLARRMRDQINASARAVAVVTTLQR